MVNAAGAMLKLANGAEAKAAPAAIEAAKVAVWKLG